MTNPYDRATAAMNDEIVVVSGVPMTRARAEKIAERLRAICGQVAAEKVANGELSEEAAARRVADYRPIEWGEK